MSDLPDPYAEFFDWCLANGFKDVAELSAEEMDPKRFCEAMEAYINKP